MACAIDGETLVDVSLSDTLQSNGEEKHARASSSLEALTDSLGDRYEIQRKLGEGGMGAVYEARHAKIGKRVAIKVLLEKYLEKPDVVARLLQEARMASSIGHENIVDITDFGETGDGRTYFVMEYLEGESLAALIEREGALPAPRAIRIIRQVASALAAAHDKGILHRDVKPENVFVIRRAEKDFVKVLDFGISKMTKPEEDGGPDVSPRLTQTGVVLGTPLYMSPEQASGEEALDHRIDIYALGTMLYETLTGEVPFSGPNYLSIISQILSKEPRPPSEVRPELGIPPDLEAVVLKAMAKDRDARYQTMNELDADLERVEGGGRLGLTAPTVRPRRRILQVAAWAGGVTVVVLGVALAVPRFIHESKRRDPPLAPPVLAAPTVAPAPPPPAPEPRMIRARVTSTPPGAEVWWESVKKGETPLELSLPHGDDQIELSLRLAGHEDAKAKFYPTSDQEVAVTLSPRKKASASSSSSRKRAAERKKAGGPTSGGEIKPSPFAK